ncbi:MAG: DUF5675 family protein [Burkholderiales bacterium]|jgi:hypothetical protein
MRMLLERFEQGATCTIGTLLIDGDFECYVLEDVIREVPGQPVETWKVKGKTAIPAGEYRVLITMSNRFKRDLPLLVGVPGFEGIRIHPGNTDADTDGCLLPGLQIAPQGEMVTQSRAAFQRLFERIEGAIAAGEEVWITITNPNGETP